MNTLIFYVCVFSLVSFTFAQDVEQETSSSPKKFGEDNKYYDICLTENNVSADDMFTKEELISKYLIDFENPESDITRLRKNGCIYQCLLEKMGVMEGSEIKVDEMRAKLSERPNYQEDVLMACIQKANEKTDKYEKSFTAVSCYNQPAQV